MGHRISPLSPVQRRYLWLRAHGSSEAEAREVLGVYDTYKISAEVRRKLGAPDLVNAVYTAMTEDMIGPREVCGTMAGIKRHQDGREDLCRACLKLNVRYADAEQSGKYTRTPILTDREAEVVRLLPTDLTRTEIEAKLGRTRYAMNPIWTALYKKLGVTGYPHQVRRSAAVEAAIQYGFVESPDTPAVIAGRLEAETVVPKLTELEIRTLAVLADGTSLTRAAVILNVRASTNITGRLANIYRKLGVEHVDRPVKRAAAVEAARAQGYPV